MTPEHEAREADRLALGRVLQDAWKARAIFEDDPFAIWYKLAAIALTWRDEHPHHKEP